MANKEGSVYAAQKPWNMFNIFVEEVLFTYIIICMKATRVDSIT